MCVKEFYGYDCGHCSIPFLKQCPLSASNPIFPVCALPAERPIYTKENCHPCSRIVWNTKVLREEEEHRGRHIRGECGCEVIFDGEDREKIVTPRLGRGKGKGKALEGGTFEQRGERHASEESGGMEIVLAAEAGTAVTREEWEPEAQMAAYNYTGYYLEHSHPQLANTAPAIVAASDGYTASGEVMGAGIKWYPDDVLAYEASEFSYYPRAASEPNPRTKASASREVDGNPDNEQPTAINSEAAGLNSR
jgi:hypothetical protein